MGEMMWFTHLLKNGRHSVEYRRGWKIIVCDFFFSLARSFFFFTCITKVYTFDLNIFPITKKFCQVHSDCVNEMFLLHFII